MKKVILGGAVLAMVATVVWAVEWKVAEPKLHLVLPKGSLGAPGLQDGMVVFHRASRGEGGTGPLLWLPAHFFPHRPLEERPKLDSGWSTRGLVMGHAAITDIEGGAPSL